MLSNRIPTFLLQEVPERDAAAIQRRVNERTIGFTRRLCDRLIAR